MPRPRPSALVSAAESRCRRAIPGDRWQPPGARRPTRRAGSYACTRPPQGSETARARNSKGSRTTGRVRRHSGCARASRIAARSLPFPMWPCS
ncbi:MAG: hypothetical protein ACK559_41820 [bacterium]